MGLLGLSWHFTTNFTNITFLTTRPPDLHSNPYLNLLLRFKRRHVFMALLKFVQGTWNDTDGVLCGRL